MDERLIRFFKKINFNDVTSFENATLKECVINKREHYWTLKINAPKIININSLLSLIALCKDGIDDVKKINIEMYYEDQTDTDILDYFMHFFKKELENNKSLSTIDLDLIDCVDKTIYITVISDIDKENILSLQKGIKDNLSKLGIELLGIEVVIDEKENKKVKQDINKIKSEAVEPVYRREEPTDDKPYYMRKKKVEYKREGNVSISSIIKEENSCNIDAYIFKNQFDEIKKKDGGVSYLMTLWISDNTYSIKCKRFAKDEEEFKEFGKTFKEGNWFHFVGDVRYDKYEKDLVFNVNTYEQIDNPIIKRSDSSPKKRIELHAHTMMSQMDGIIDEGVLVKQAMSWGMPGLAITDHDGCQAFPVVFDAVTKYNKGKKKEFDEKIQENEIALEELKNNDSANKEGIKQLEDFINELKDEKEHFKPFKALYGVELDMCESYLNVCFNPNDELLKDNTFVIFDTETTGFNAGVGNSMIEIGGVKVKNGEIIDRYDSLINPGCKIDPEITKVTNITDDDVKDAPNEETVIKEFKEWIGNLPLVAHNARFDKSMLDMAYYKYDLGELTNPIIDTLMLSRVINRDLKRHSLAALGKAYGVDTGEADDEEGNANEVSSTDFKIDENEIEDILVDGESILKVIDVEYQEAEISTEEVVNKVKQEYYLPTIYKASKTESINLEVKLKDGFTLIEFNPEYKLHAAENQCTFTYQTPFGPKSIYVSIYVGEHHGADVDAENTSIIFNKMLKQIDGIEKISDLNNLGLLEETSIKNNHKYKEHIGEISSYKNYVRLIEEDEELPEDVKYPFEKYGNKDYVWKYPWCDEDNLQMYENIPAKTFTEHLANIYDGTKHVTLIAKTQEGLKNLFKIISFANSNFMQRNARIPRKLIEEYKEGILIGSACLNGEIFNIALTRSEEELIKAMEFYDYIEIQPLDNYEHLLRNHDINNMNDLKKCIKKIIDCANKAKKLIVATGDVHILNEEDNLYREIIVNQNVPGKGRHTLARYLNGYKRQNSNNENVEEAINKAKRNGVELTSIDIKILKYIYALQLTPSIPITSNNLCNIYVANKNNPDELRLKNKGEDKRYEIDSSLRRLQISGLINFDYDNGIYYLTSKYNKGEKYKEGHIPAQYFRTTEEMIDSFSWLKDDKLVNEIVIDNTYKIMDQVDILEVILHPHKPFSPIIEHSQETCRDLVFEKAQSMYGNPLPRNIEERIAEEFYGGTIYKLVDDYIEQEHPGITDEEKDKIYSASMHEVVMKGFNFVVELYTKRLMNEDETLDLEDAKKKAIDSLSGIIGGGFDVIYLIAQKLVKHSNDRGYLVGSRGSVGSSFVAAMMGITECNSLPPHYYCPECQYSMFHEDDGKLFTFVDEQGEEQVYLSGFDLPERKCPKCGADFIHQGNDMPFATFLGFQGEKVPDIDLNFSGDDQPFAHDYTKVLFGTDNVYRAGTIATVADKTAFGYVQGYFEEKVYDKLKNECKIYGLDLSGKDDLKREKVIVSDCRVAEVERLAIGCTGVKRTTGQHPGGIVVVPGYKDVFDFTPFQYPADDPTAAWRTTHFDYHKIEDDLLKLDILGHDDPTVLRMLQDLSGIDVTQIDLGDKDTMSIFTGPEILGVKPEQLRGLTKKDGTKYCPTGTLGVPEFGTSFLLGMLEETKPKTFAELIKISGLSHGTDVWLGNARDLIVNNVVPFSKVIGCRDDIMVNLIAWGVPAGKAFKIMEFVRKGKPSKDPAGWAEHVKTLQEYNIPEYYIDSCRKIKYMFPKAHATAYVTSAFRIAWFKVHHPIWYYCAYLSIRRDQFDIVSMVQGENAIRAKIDEIDATPNPSNKDIDTRETLQICLEAACRGIYFKNVDLNKSDAKHFVITEDQKGLIIPFRAIDGLGENVAYSIVKARNEAPFISQEDLKIRGKVSGSTIDKFKELGCIENMPESNQLSLF